ncbi:MAG: GNAT family N-acetyltransferase [Pseudomonadota bacterium]
MEPPIVVRPFPEAVREQAARLYFAAFERKIGGILSRDGRGIRFLTDVIDPAFGFAALSADQSRLLGIAGFKTSEGSLVGGSFGDLKQHYGLIGSLWRALALAPMERDIEPSRLLMDGIAVVPEARGMGIGSKLLDAICEHAAETGLDEVRLDVISSNPRARSLYERKGFVAGEETDIGPLKHLYGFSQSTTMIYSVP